MVEAASLPKSIDSRLLHTNWTCLALRPSADDDFSGILPVNIKHIISLMSDIHKYRVDQGYYIYK